MENIFCDGCKDPIGEDQECLDLACGHMFCLKCIVKPYSLIDSKDPNKIINCPSCNTQQKLKRSEVALIKRYLEEKSMPQYDSKFYYCDSHENRPIEYLWTQGKKFICVDCFGIEKINSEDIKKMSQEMIPKKTQELINEIDLQIRILTENREKLTKIIEKEVLSSGQILKLFGQARQLLINVVAPELKQRIQNIDLLDFEPIPVAVSKIDPKFDPKNLEYLEKKVQEPVKISIESLIIPVIEDQGKLVQMLDPGSSLTLLFRGSRDGFKAKICHSKIDNQGPTLCLISTDKGKIFGGYTNIPLTLKEDYTKDQSKSFLFKFCSNKTFRKFQHFKGNEINQVNSYLFWFSEGFCIVENCNLDSDSFLFDLGRNYQGPEEVKQGTNAYWYFLNDGDDYFKVQEIEIYKVK